MQSGSRSNPAPNPGFLPVGAEETAASRRHRALHRQAKYLALSTPASQAKPRAASGRPGPRPSPRLNTSGDARGGV